MFRIRKILDNTTPANRHIVGEVVDILKAQFPDTRPNDIWKLPHQLNDPFPYRYRSILIISEDGSSRLRGFAMLLHFTDLKIGYLELISTAPNEMGGGIGSALYEKVREECRDLNLKGLFFECEVDDAQFIDDIKDRKNREKRLRFYEKYGAYPVINNLYAAPVHPGDKDLYYLMFDNLGHLAPPSMKEGRNYVRAILERKYGDLISQEQIEEVVASFADNPWVLRTPRFVKPESRSLKKSGMQHIKIGLVANQHYDIDHAKELGYSEAPVKVDLILEALAENEHFEKLEIHHKPKKWILAVHDKDYIHYLRTVCRTLESDRSVYSIVFPFDRREFAYNKHQKQVGFYATDAYTPLSKNVYLAATSAVDCTLTAADYLLSGKHFSYSLNRPPGHHAGKGHYGAFCYINSTAVAADYLSRFGNIAVLDIDYHHGNGTQEIFYDRADVFTVSIHANPRFAYPFTSGFSEETGDGEGVGCNLNLPLPLQAQPNRFKTSLIKALSRIKHYNPVYLLVSFGFDTAAADPTGSWNLRTEDFLESGSLIGRTKIPTLIIQEGGYRHTAQGNLARAFFQGLVDGYLS